MKWHVHRKYVFTFALCRCWWTGQNWSLLVEFFEFSTCFWLQSQMHPSSTEAVVFTHPDVDHILGNQAGCHSTDWMRLDLLQVTSPCTYIQKTHRHKIQYSIAQMYRFQISLDIFRLLTFLNAVTSHLFWGSSVGYSSIWWWAGAARHPGTGGKGKNHVRCLVFKDLVSIHVKRFQVDSFSSFFMSFWDELIHEESLDLTPLHRKHWCFHLFSGG